MLTGPILQLTYRFKCIPGNLNNKGAGEIKTCIPGNLNNTGGAGEIKTMFSLNDM